MSRTFREHRRTLLIGGGAALLAGSARAAEILPALRALEDEVSGRLGVHAVRDNGQVILSYRPHERFPMASTFKASLAAAVLARVDRGQEHLDRIVPYTAADLISNSPVTGGHAAERGLPVETLCKAIIEVSDNLAANLLLRSVGGPAGLTRYWRRIGDRTSRLDRTELTLNEGLPGDSRDTTSPAAMALTLNRMVLGAALSPASRSRLTGWLLGTRTGLTMLRAGMPPSWPIGDKTGQGGNGSTNDIAVVWPDRGRPFTVAAYLTGTDVALERRKAVIAKVGRIVAEAA